MMPSQGIGGYAITKTLFELNVKTAGLNNGVSAAFNVEPSSNGIRGKRLWHSTMATPRRPIAFTGKLVNMERARNPTPIAAITSNSKVWKPASKNSKKFTTRNSRNIRYTPRFNKKLWQSANVRLRRRDIYAEVPARKTKVGAHK
jgi:hypothetical protein